MASCCAGYDTSPCAFLWGAACYSSEAVTNIQSEGSQMDFKHQSYCCFTYRGICNIWDLLSIVIQHTWICEASNPRCVWSMLYSSYPCTVMHLEISGKYWTSSKASLLEGLGGRVEHIQGNTSGRLVWKETGQSEKVIWKYYERRRNNGYEVQAHLKSMMKLPLTSEGIPGGTSAVLGPPVDYVQGVKRKRFIISHDICGPVYKVRNSLAQGQEVGSISAIIDNVLYCYVDEFSSGKLHLLLQHMADIYYSLTICNGLYAKQPEGLSAYTEKIIANSNNHDYNSEMNNSSIF